MVTYWVGNPPKTRDGSDTMERGHTVEFVEPSNTDRAAGILEIAEPSETGSRATMDLMKDTGIEMAPKRGGTIDVDGMKHSNASMDGMK